MLQDTCKQIQDDRRDCEISLGCCPQLVTVYIRCHSIGYINSKICYNYFQLLQGGSTQNISLINFCIFYTGYFLVRKWTESKRTHRRDANVPESKPRTRRAESVSFKYEWDHSATDFKDLENWETQSDMQIILVKAASRISSALTACPTVFRQPRDSSVRSARAFSISNNGTGIVPGSKSANSGPESL